MSEVWPVWTILRLPLWTFFIFLFFCSPLILIIFLFLFYFVCFVNHSIFQPITAKDEFSFSGETVLPSHGFQPMGVYHVGLLDGLWPFVNVACGPREVKQSCDFLEIQIIKQLVANPCDARNSYIKYVVSITVLNS